MTETELRERVSLVLKATRGRWTQANGDERNAIITALSGMEWALGESDLDESDLREVLKSWADMWPPRRTT